MGAVVHQLLWQRRGQQKDLAQSMRLDPTAVSRLLRGERHWRLDDLASAASYLGLSAPALLADSEAWCARQDSNLQPLDP